jgi:hypothetical protein
MTQYVLLDAVKNYAPIGALDVSGANGRDPHPDLVCAGGLHTFLGFAQTFQQVGRHPCPLIDRQIQSLFE